MSKKTTPKIPTVFGLDYFVAEIPSDFNPELLQSTVDMGQFIRWVFLYTYAKAIDLMTNYAQDIGQKAWPFNVTILSLETVLAPLHDEEFVKNIAYINAKYNDELYDNPVQKWLDPAFGLEHLREIVRLLNRQDILTTRTYAVKPKADWEDLKALLELDKGGGSESEEKN